MRILKGWGMVTNDIERFRVGAWARGAVVFCVFVLTCSAHVFGQWVTYPTPNVPRLADGKPDLKAPAPRQPDMCITPAGSQPLLPAKLLPGMGTGR